MTIAFGSRLLRVHGPAEAALSRILLSSLGCPPNEFLRAPSQATTINAAALVGTVMV